VPRGSKVKRKHGGTKKTGEERVHSFISKGHYNQSGDNRPPREKEVKRGKLTPILRIEKRAKYHRFKERVKALPSMESKKSDFGLSSRIKTFTTG